MNAKSFDIKKALMKSGKDEFLVSGFEKASLRTICKKAGVTTGAFYAYFDKKEDLFEAIVTPMLSAFYHMYNEVVRSALTDVRNNESNELRAMEFICEHLDEFRLLFDCSKGTGYADFQKKMLEELFMSSYQACFDRYAGCHVDPNIVWIFVRIKYAQYMEIAYGDYSMEERRKVIRLYASFTETGFMKLIDGITDKETNA